MGGGGGGEGESGALALFAFAGKLSIFLGGRIMKKNATGTTGMEGAVLTGSF